MAPLGIADEVDCSTTRCDHSRDLQYNNKSVGIDHR